MITNDAVWFITGTSRGLGRALAVQVLDAGYCLAATARDASVLSDLAAAYPDRVLTLSLDVTDQAQVKAAIGAAERRFGRIDVLVNNAGYGYLGAIEEGEEAEVRRLFETDLFGPVELIKLALPGMRQRGHGQIVNISSIGGLVTFPGVGYYNMAKAGVEALSDVLAKEVASFGINVTVVAPGAFRTDFRAPASLRLSKTVIADYEDTVGRARIRTVEGDGSQPGDPMKAAQAIIAAVKAERPPVHLLLGSDAIDLLRAKLDELRHESDRWEATSRGTDFESA